MQNVLNILESRGLIEAVTSPEAHRLLEKPCAVYAGFDPTSESLQVGNLVTVMVLSHFQRCGHRVIAVVGGATGMIGDPSGKSAERPFLTQEEVERNVAGIRRDLSRFLDFDHPTAPAKIVNNGEWLGVFSFIDFLRDVGRHFRLGAMLGKESVKTRLNSDAGMNFAEFSYQLLQAYDFLHLYDTAGCAVQVGGSDQWGNITAGIDLIRKLRGGEAHGVTTPLVCDSSGQKFGKSEGNAVYLNRSRTSCYDFYQFFVRVDDADAIRFLKIFTFLPLDEIASLESDLKRSPEERAAQKRLAGEVTRLVHGQRGLTIAERASSVLFGGAMEGLHSADLLEIFANVPSAEMPRKEVVNAGIVDVACRVGLCRSKGEARRLIEGGGLYLNNARVDGVEKVVSEGDLIDGGVLVLRSGRKSFHLVKVV